MAGERAPDGVARVEHRRERADAERARRFAGQGKLVSRDACEEGCRQHGHSGVRSSPDPSVGSLHDERYERQQAERGEHRSRRRRGARGERHASSAPASRPRVRRRRSRRSRRRSRSGRREPRERNARPARGSSQHAMAAATTIAATSSGGQNGRNVAPSSGGDDAERDRHRAARVALCRGERLLVLRGAFLAGRATLRRPQCVPQLGGEVGRVRSRRGIDRERRVDGGDEAAREASALGRQRRRAGLDGARDLLDGHSPERDAGR